VEIIVKEQVANPEYETHAIFIERDKQPIDVQEELKKYLRPLRLRRLSV
jgi:hypothetical protein